MNLDILKAFNSWFITNFHSGMSLYLSMQITVNYVAWNLWEFCKTFLGVSQFYIETINQYCLQLPTYYPYQWRYVKCMVCTLLLLRVGIINEHYWVSCPRVSCRANQKPYFSAESWRCGSLPLCLICAFLMWCLGKDTAYLYWIIWYHWWCPIDTNKTKHKCYFTLHLIGCVITMKSS